MNRFRTKSRDLDVADATHTVRTKVLDAADSARDIADVLRARAETLAQSAPSRTDVADSSRAAAHKARHSRAGERVAAGVGAVLPLVPGALQHFARSRRATRAGRLTPVVVRTHPVLAGFVLAGGAVALLVALRAVRRRRLHDADDAAAHDAARVGAFDLDEEVARMEGEGGAKSSVQTARPGRLRRSTTRSTPPLTGVPS